MAYNKETGMYEGFIYKIWNDVNSVFYVGRTYRTIEKRWKEHCDYSTDHKTDLYRAIRGFGLDHFHIELIENLYSETKNGIRELCFDREKYWISYYKNNGYILYNMTDGGDDVAEIQYPESPVIQYDLFCKELNKFDSIAEASEISGIGRSDISTCCLKTGKTYSTGNYIWRYIDDPLTESEISDLNQRYKGVAQYSFNGELLNVFYRPIDAAIYIDPDNYKSVSGNISKCLSGKVKSANGYIWRYRLDPFDKYEMPKQIRRVFQYSFTGELLGIFDNCKHAAQITGVDKGSINLCCLHKIQYADKYIWCYEDENPNLDIVLKWSPVDCYDLNKKYIASFESIKDASAALHITPSAISSVCQNRNKVAKGYIFRYSGDDISTYIY